MNQKHLGNILGGILRVSNSALFALCIVCTMGITSCGGSGGGGKEVITPMPTVTWNVSPAATASDPLPYGDSIKVANWTATNTIGLYNGSIKAFMPLHDTALSVTVSGSGGTTTSVYPIKVASPSAKIMMIVGTWYLRKEYVMLPDGTWKDMGELTTCLKSNKHVFSLDFTEISDNNCSAGTPAGWSPWGLRLNGTKLFWNLGTDPTTKAEKLYELYSLSDTQMKLTYFIPDLTIGAPQGAMVNAMFEYGK